MNRNNNNNIEWSEIYELIAKNAQAQTKIEMLTNVFSDKEMYTSTKIEFACAILGIKEEEGAVQ